MILESWEKGHGEREEIPSGDILKTILHRGTVRGILGIIAVERGICVPQMRLLPRLPAVQWTVSVCPMPPSGFCNGRDRTAEDSYAPDAVVSGVLSGMPGQTRHFRRTTVQSTGDDLQNSLVYAQAYSCGYGAAGQKISTERHYRI